ncbi:MAG: cupin domain-containing protein [Acidobacteriota bacterium]
MIEHWDDQQWGELNEQNMRDKLRSEGYSNDRALCVHARDNLGEHTHPVEKKDVVLEGELRVVMGQEDYVLLPGDSIVIPAQTPHTVLCGRRASDVISLDASREE